MNSLYHRASLLTSKVVTNCYSTSFSLGIKALSKEVHEPIYAIYGFVRLADEIVDTFHTQDKEALLKEFVRETGQAIQRKFSLNPVLNSFQWVVNKYQIEQELIDAFIKSMEFDLLKVTYSQKEYEEYIYGSAEVVGLMCLRIFCYKDNGQYEQLKYAAQRLGSAFQKINFLRDLKDDYENKGRTYFPKIDIPHFKDSQKREIEKDIFADFNAGFSGIKQLPHNAQFGVYTVYSYYLALFYKIRTTPAEQIRKERIRIPNSKKYKILAQCYFKMKLGKIALVFILT